MADKLLALIRIRLATFDICDTEGGHRQLKEQLIVVKFEKLLKKNKKKPNLNKIPTSSYLTTTNDTTKLVEL